MIIYGRFLDTTCRRRDRSTFSTWLVSSNRVAVIDHVNFSSFLTRISSLTFRCTFFFLYSFTREQEGSFSRTGFSFSPFSAAHLPYWVDQHLSKMVQPFLIVSVIVISVLVLLMSVLLLIKFQHKDDVTQAWAPKFVVILGFYLIFGVAMLMPYDVANRDDGGIDMDTLWLIGLCATAVMIFLIIPFFFCYYENDSIDDEKGKRRGCCEKQCMQAVFYSLAFTVFIAVLTVILYATPANTAEVPVHLIQQNITNVVTMCNSTDSTFQYFYNARLANCADNGGGCTTLGQTFLWEIQVTYVVYLLALLAFIGWWFFFLFAGVGLIALPFDLINEFRTRPQPMTKIKFMSECDEIARKTDEAISVARSLRDGDAVAASAGDRSSRQTKQMRTKILAIEQNYYFLRRDFDMLKISRDYSQSNPLWYILKLVLGILGLVISIMWFLHMAIFILPGRGYAVDPFLNKIFIELSSIPGFPLFGILAFTIFVFYLQWCVVKGNFKLGIRFLVFKMYPMEVGNTYMSAFLANIWVLCLCTFPLVQFITVAFPVYARYTAIETLFGGQIKYLRGFKVFWEENIFIYLLLAMSFFTIPVVLCCPVDQRKELKKKLDAKAAERQRRI